MVAPLADLRWEVTPAFVRAGGVAAVVIAVALIWRRPDLLVVATPLAIVAVWSAITRPTREPAVVDRLGTGTLREGEATMWHGDLQGGPELDLAVAVLADAPWTDRQPASGALAVPVDGGSVDLRIGVRSTRWGVRAVEPVLVISTPPWASFRWTHRTSRLPLTTLPLPAPFDAAAATRPSDGLVGQHRSARPGEGNEFAAIRPYQSGDRMRRINWPRSQRAGTLQVNATWSDLDLHLALVVDATDDFGVSEGIDGVASSLDLSVRAAGAIAEHYAPRGERVSLRAFGTATPLLVPPATGSRQLRRILDQLARMRVVERTRAVRIGARDRHLATGGQLTVMLSPLVAPEAVDHAVALGRAGHGVIVVDTLPEHVVVDDDPHTVMAWRIRLLERRRELRAVRASGIPVVEWRGPGSLDQVIRDVSRRAAAPRMVVR